MSLDTRGTQGCPGREQDGHTARAGRPIKRVGCEGMGEKEGERERLERRRGCRQAKMADDATPTMSITPFFDAKPSQPPSFRPSERVIHPTSPLPPSLSLARSSLPAAFSSTTFRQPTHPPLDYIHENDDALSRRDFPRLLASARGN